MENLPVPPEEEVISPSPVADVAKEVDVPEELMNPTSGIDNPTLDLRDEVMDLPGSVPNLQVCCK